MLSSGLWKSIGVIFALLFIGTIAAIVGDDKLRAGDSYLGNALIFAAFLILAIVFYRVYKFVKG